MSAQYRFDKLKFSTVLPNYINLPGSSGSISISGTVANGTSKNFSTSINLTDGSTFFDVYATNPTLFIPENKVQLISNSSMATCYSYISSEFVQNSVSFSGGIVTVTITVNNFTGASISLTSQTVNISVVEYALPL